MAFIDGFVAAVPEARRQDYLDHAGRMAEVMRRHGALRCLETCGTDVPDGELTSFPMAVRREEGEAVVLAWVWWPDRETRDAAWAAMMSDEAMQAEAMPFDGRRMIFGGFDVMLEA